MVSTQHDGDLARALVALVRRVAARTGLLWSVDGWCLDVQAIIRTFRDWVLTSGRGRPPEPAGSGGG